MAEAKKNILTPDGLKALEDNPQLDTFICVVEGSFSKAAEEYINCTCGY